MNFILILFPNLKRLRDETTHARSYGKFVVAEPVTPFKILA
jgi:hypothetical protein